MTIRSTVSTVGLFALCLILNKEKELVNVTGRDILVFGASALLAGILGMWTYYTGLKMEATSKIVPIAASYPLVTALLSFLILGERLTLHRIIGTLLIISGIWLVK